MNEQMISEPTAQSTAVPAGFNLPVLETERQSTEWFSSSESTANASLASLDIDLIDEHIEDPRIQEVRNEIVRLKQLSQYLTTYNGSLKKLIEAEFPSPSAKRQLLGRLVDEYGISRRHVCRLLNLARSTCWYKSTAKSAVSA